MQKHKKTGLLQADLPKGVPSMRGPCHAEIALKAGNISSCYLTNNRGILLTGEKAYQELVRVGRLHWTFVARTPSVSQMPSGSQPPSVSQAPSGSQPVVRSDQPGSEKNAIVRPYRTILVEQRQMQSWPHLHKQVYGLADGTRSATEIADLLMTTSEAIEAILRDLRSIHVIV